MTKRCLRTLAATLLAALALIPTVSRSEIIKGTKASALENYAAKELQRYLYQLSGRQLTIQTGTQMNSGEPFIVIGTPESNPLIRKMAIDGRIKISGTEPGAQGYVLKTVGDTLVIAGSDEEGVLYGVYGLLEDHCGIRFYMGGDVLPRRDPHFKLPQLNERKKPLVSIRGILPWTNFPQSATVYSWKDWKFIIDQSAKMRMNFIHVHNYNGQTGHNEIFHNFEYKGVLSRSWMCTIRNGHKWHCPGWDPAEYLFGADELFADYDWGSDCGMHNDHLSNREVFSKGVTLMQKVIDYAHKRGVKIGLGLDLDLIMPEYKERGATPTDPELVKARANQVADDYPELDVLLLFQQEDLGSPHKFTPGKYRQLCKDWRSIFDGFYNELKSRNLKTRVAVAGWGISAENVKELPEDVICGPISHYSAGFESGAIYGDREYWGCPWMERDFNSSQYYYPYNIHLTDTIKAWQARAKNMDGFYTLSWRLTDAIDPKIWYVSKAPWDTKNKLASAEAVYRDYAEHNYGKPTAELITPIINENEPFADGWGECAPTPPFKTETTAPGGTYLFNLAWMRLEAPLTATAQTNKHSKSLRIPAASAGETSGQVKPAKTAARECLGWIMANDFAVYENIEIDDSITSFSVRAATPKNGFQIELRLDSPDGELIGTCPVPATGGWETWKTASTRIKPFSGSRKLCLVFKDPQNATKGKGYLFNLLWLKFSSSAEPPRQIPADAFTAKEQQVQVATSSEGGTCLGWIKEGSWATYKDITIPTACTGITFRVASPERRTLIKVSKESITGEVVAVCEVPYTGDFKKWQDVTTELKPLNSRQDLVLTFERQPIDSLLKIDKEYIKAQQQLAIIDQAVAETEDPMQKRRLKELRCRIQAASDHIELNYNFEDYQWEDLPGAMESWVENFTHRVTDVSSLGNILSSQNRFVQQNYLKRVNDLRNSFQFPPPKKVSAKGTANGAIIRWENVPASASGFNIYRSGKKINAVPLATSARAFTDQTDGSFSYAVTAVKTDGTEGNQSIPSSCMAGSADKIAPHIVIVSPPTSALIGQPVRIEARLLDNRAAERLKAILLYRTPGSETWIKIPMTRRARAVFTAEIPATDITEEGLEYMLAASDGTNVSQYPATAPKQALSMITFDGPKTAPSAPVLSANKQRLTWNKQQDAFWYCIYRSRQPDFRPGPENYVTYVASDTSSFKEVGFDFLSQPLEGKRHYRIIAITCDDAESPASNPVFITY